MKKFISVIAALGMMTGLLAGCGSSTSAETTAPEANGAETTAADTTAELSGTVSTNGSTSMEHVISSLIEAFTAENPGVTITYDATGSGTGITAAQEGTADIGLSSRSLKEEESAAGLEGTVVALDGIAVILNTANTVEDLTLEQIAGLVSGEITNWSEVGGEDAPVAVIGREAGSGTRDGFESIVDVEDICVYDQELTSTGAVIAAVASNEYAIGYASLSAVSDEIKVVTVGGVACTEDTILDGSYAIQRPFLMVTNSASEVSPAAQAFMEFALSADATEIIANAGAVQAQ